MRRPILPFAFLVAWAAAASAGQRPSPSPLPTATPAGPQAAGTAFDEVVAPGENFDKAEFRLWCPDSTKGFRAVVVLLPGSNGDGRAQVDDPLWRAFAATQRVALVGVRLTDKPHDQPFIEHYVNVSRGSGQALLDALAAFSRKTGHPELATAPFLLWGMSAGGEFNYEFVNWKPERVIGFVVNKGGIYYTALSSQVARGVPGIMFIGGKDLDSRVQTITGLFALNRRAGALWALAEEPGAGHSVGRSRDLALMFFEDLLSLRLGDRMQGPPGPDALRALVPSSGFLGDAKTKGMWRVGEKEAPNYPTSWLPTFRLATAWQALLMEKPFDPSPSPTPMPALAPEYTIDAIRYAMVRDFGLSNLVMGASKDAKTDIAMAVWLIRGGGRTVLFDTGFHRERWMSAFKIEDFLGPDAAVRLAGVEPGAVTDIVVSHAHWDHMGGLDLFPNATIWIQKAEYDYYTGAAWQTGGRKGGIDAEDIQELVRRNLAGKVRFVDGDDQEILPGIRAYTGARHTFASQYIRVAGKQPVVLASDNCYLYENLASHRASATFERSDEAANLDAQKRMIELAGDVSRVVPGHDPEQFRRYKAVDRVARIQ